VKRDFERVKAELVKMMDKYNTQHRKHADQKLAVKNKLHSVKSVVFVHLGKFNDNYLQY